MSTGGYGTDGLFSDSRTLSGRQRELDAVRGLSVFLMVGAHVMNQFQPVSDGSGGGIIDFIATTVTGAFPGGANCFMMVMGMVMLFSTTATCRHFISRGLMLIVAGFGVEVIKLIPGLVNLWLTGDFVSFYPEFPQGTQDQLIVITLFWQDILIFAGMAMVFLGIMQRLKVSNIGLLAIVAVMMIANEFLVGMHTGNDAVDIFCGYFWGTTVFDDAMTTSRYPFFSWILYPVAGYVLAEFMVRTTDKRRFYRNVGLWFLIAIIPLTAAGILTRGPVDRPVVLDSREGGGQGAVAPVQMEQEHHLDLRAALRGAVGDDPDRPRGAEHHTVHPGVPGGVRIRGRHVRADRPEEEGAAGCPGLLKFISVVSMEGTPGFSLGK